LDEYTHVNLRSIKRVNAATMAKDNETRRFHLAIDSKIAEAVTSLSDYERRTINAMFEVLLVEALVARGVVEKPAPPKFTLD
jgi:hypothetical protein